MYLESCGRVLKNTQQKLAKGRVELPTTVDE